MVRAVNPKKNNPAKGLVKSSQYNGLVVVGANHKVLSVSLREKLAKAFSKIEAFEDIIGSLSYVKLSTCNRFEILVHGEAHAELIAKKLKSIVGESGTSREAIYLKKGDEAIKHFFRVISGLDAVVVGETQITKQVKDAYQRSIKEGSVDKVIHHVVQYGLRLAKRIRNFTEISAHGLSISAIGVKLAEQVFSTLKHKRVLIVGSGETAELVAIHLIETGCHNFLIANRTRKNAENLAVKIKDRCKYKNPKLATNVEVLNLSEIGDAINKSDILISSIDIEEPIITPNLIVARTVKSPYLLLDLGVPRNIAPSISELRDIYLYNLDDLSSFVKRNLEVRTNATVHAEWLVNDGLFSFNRWLHDLENTNLYSELSNLISRNCHSVITSVLERELEIKSTDTKLIANQVFKELRGKIAFDLLKALKNNSEELTNEEILSFLLENYTDSNDS